jgi:uncharacterized protein (TIGR02271 family)
MDELLASGFTRTDVNVSSADSTGQTDGLGGSTTGSSSSMSTDTHDESIGSSIKHFFSGLFGSDSDEHATRYAGAVSSGHHVLTVTTQSEPEVERAADVIERFGPIDIDERHDLSGSAGSMDAGMLAAGAASGSGLQKSSSMSAQSGSTGSSSYGSGSLSGETGERNSFATQDLNDPVPKGQTYQEPLGSSMQASSDDSLGGTIQSGSMQRDMGEQLNEQRSTAIPVVQEELKVGKREVQRGGVRVFSRVVETPVNESVSLREEHVSVERHRVDQPISTTDATAFKEQSIEMRERAEEAVVQKSARVVEEVVVGKEATQRKQNIKDTVRHTEVQVEQLGRSGMDDDSYYRSHYTSNYGTTGGSYDDYAPAYTYGSQMRSDSRYQGRQWDDVESDLRTDWESRNRGKTGSTWEKMKAAVRHGWDKITSDSTDDSYYRSHYTSNYGTTGGSYDDYAPAYTYGSQMRSDSRYKGRQWDDVEPSLRSDWDTRYPGSGGASTWEKMKAAVRHGWDKVTS